MTPDALTLIIETSNPGSGAAGEVGLARGADVFSTRLLDPKDRHDDALMPTVAAVCAAAGVGADELGRVVVSVGPGGYSAVRIAVSAAKMISLVTGADCVGVPSCRVAACGAGVEGLVAVAMAGKRERAWVRLYEIGVGGVRAVSDGESMDAEGLVALHAKGGFGCVVGDSFVPMAMRGWAEGAGIRVVPPVMSAAALWAASAGIEPVSGEELAALYPREPEAVRKWRELHAS